MTNKWNLSCYSPRVQAVLFGFRRFVRGRGGLTSAAVPLDADADESRKKMADGVARSPSRLCSKDGKICCYGYALSTIFLLACFCVLLPTFRFSFLSCFFSYFSLHPGMFIFFVSLRLCSSHLLLSAKTYSIVRVLSACCVICTLPHLGILFVFYWFSILFVLSLIHI